MISERLAVCALCLAALAAFTQRAAGEGGAPQERVRLGVSLLEQAVERHRDTGDQSVDAFATDVRIFLSQFADIPTTARLSLARHWRTASEQQRRRFEHAMTDHVTGMLVRFLPTVDLASMTFSEEEEVLQASPRQVQVQIDGGEEQPLTLTLVVHERDGQWKIFDVITEGVSYVKLFRSQFDGEVRDLGVESMLRSFEERSAPSAWKTDGD